MKIKINIQIFAIIIILIIAKQIEIYVWLMLFAFIHEMAHTIVGLILKLKPKTIEIQPFGVGIIFESFENSEKNKIIVAIAGPIANILIALIFIFIKTKAQITIICVNILLALFNLIPIYPMDGGRILKAILTIRKGRENAETAINKISNITLIIITSLSSILILLYKNIGLFIIIIYLWILVMKENKRYELNKRIRNIIKNKNTKFSKNKL